MDSKLCKRVLIVFVVVLLGCSYTVLASRKERYSHPLVHRLPYNASAAHSYASTVSVGPSLYRRDWLAKVKADARAGIGILSKDMINRILNASGVFGLGILWIKELNNAVGTNLLAPFMIAPLLFLTGALLFVPDLANLGNILENPAHSTFLDI